MSAQEESDKSIFLIGEVATQFSDDKLPSNREVLKIFFYKTRKCGLNIHDSASSVVKEILALWKKAGLETKKQSRCIELVKNLHKNWNELQKRKNQTSNKQKELDFVEKLDDLFDIGHINVLNIVDATRQRFLLNQRKKGRQGCFADIESVSKEEEMMEIEKHEKTLQRLHKSQAEMEKYDKLVELVSSDDEISQIFSQHSVGAYSNVSLEDLDDLNDYFQSVSQKSLGDYSPKSASDQPAEKKSKSTRGTINVFTDKVVAVLDKCKTSDRDAVRIIVAIAEALNVDPKTLIINKTSVRRYRERIREARILNIKTVFKNTDLNAMVLHWDGKLLPSLLDRDAVVDRLPVVVTNGETEKLLGIPPLENGKGKTQAAAIYDVLEDWGLKDNVKAFCCDTTVSNLGITNGTAVLLEQLLEKNILIFPCRHHCHELILRAAFEIKLPLTTGPNVQIFKRFKDAWKQIDQTKYHTGMENEEVKKILLPDVIDRIHKFVQNQLTITQPRDDYKELLELTLVFLGIPQPRQYRFHPPGAMHHARWMAKAIYCLKIFLFRDSFKMVAREKKAIQEISVFVVTVYIESWFTAPLAASAPNNDLQLLKKLNSYKNIDKEISDACVRKLINHLWYLNSELSALSFFDENVSHNIKQKMVVELDLQNESGETIEESDFVSRRNISIKLKDVDEFCLKEMDYFISPVALNFFNRFGIETKYLKTNPLNWSNSDDYQYGLQIVNKLKVVNDVAERAIRLIEEYNGILSKNENQKQYLLQLISDYRKKFPSANKETLIQDY